MESAFCDRLLEIDGFGSARPKPQRLLQGSTYARLDFEVDHKIRRRKATYCQHVKDA